MTSKHAIHGIALRALAGLVAGSVLALSGTPVQATPRDDWTGVASLPQGIPTRLRLHAADPISGREQIKGLLESADTTSITLKLRDGEYRAIEKGHVRKVAVPRKLSKSYSGWIVLGVTIAATWLVSVKNSDPPNPLFFGPGSGLSGLAFWKQRWRDIYRSPAGSGN